MNRYRALIIFSVLVLLFFQFFLRSSEAERPKQLRMPTRSAPTSKVDVGTSRIALAKRPTPPQSPELVPVSSKAVGFAESVPLRTLPLTSIRADAQSRRESEDDREINELNTITIGTPNPNAKSEPDGALQSSFRRSPDQQLNIPSPSLTFEGLSAADNTAIFGTTVAPPDPDGAVGPNDYVQTTNNLVRVYDKNGVPRTPAFKLSSLFTSLGGICATNDQGDTIVLYDRMANRWLISQFAFANQTAPPYHQCIAISKNGDPTGAYWTYDFITPGAEFPDYPKFGAWPDGYYYTTRQFTNGGPFNSFGAFAFDRAKMLVGDPTASFIYFNLGAPLPRQSNASSGMIPTDFTGLTPPPVGSPNIFAVYTDDQFTGDISDTVRLFNFHADFASPPSSSFLERSESPVLVAGFDSRNPTGRADIEEPPPAAAGDSLDSLGDRLMLRLQYINRGGTESLLLCHTVNAGTIPAPGILPTRAQYKAATRYYEFRKTSPGGAYTVPEQATFSPDANERWMGSVAMDNAGNIAVGYSLSSTSIFPSIAYAGRLASDAPNGLFQGEATMFSGTGSQIGTQNRWGDYSALHLDPSDDATFWYVNEYYATSPAPGFDWHTRIGRFKFAGTNAPPQGTLSGTITACDTGQPLADALVEVTGGPSSPFSTATAPDGTYSFNLSPGTYQVTIGDPAHNCSSIGPFAILITDGMTTTQNGCLSGTPKFALVSTAISGGNGDGAIDRNECVALNVTIQNIGCLVSSNVTGQLATSTPNVTIVLPTTTFPTLNENATGSSQIAFAVETSPSFVCGTPINFTLTINSPLGGGTTIPFSLPTCQVPAITINGALTAGDLQQQLRLGRNGIASVCGTQKANPGTLGAGPRLYDLYSFVNGPTATCVTIGLTPSCSAATNPIISVAYLNSFNPADITQNYRGDPGGSPNTGSTATFSVDVPANTTLLVNVHEINPGLAGCSGYTLSVAGLVGNNDGGSGCPACMITCPANITVSNDPNQCGAVVTYPAPTTSGLCGTVTCSPASGSFFPKGTTPVNCSTTAGPTCSFTVTVNDTQPPTITCPANIVAGNDPNQCGRVVTYPAPTVSDNCPGVTAPVCAPASGSFFPTGPTTVTCNTTDAAGNTAGCSFTVTINDTQPPTITCPANIVTETAPGMTSANVDYDPPKVSDNCPGVTASYNIPSGSNFPIGTTTVTGTATDAAGNMATCTFTVTVVQKQLSINDVTVTEGDSGSVNAVFTVTLTPTSATQTVTVDFFTSNGSATQPGDYSSINGTLTFAPGQATRTIVVSVNGDTLPEPSETFFVNLINPTNAAIADAQGQGTILDNDASGNFQFGAGTATVGEGEGSVSVTVTRTGDSSGEASVRYETSDGTAIQKMDYIFGAGVVQFAPGETSKTINVLLVDDVYVEGSETFNINLSSPSGNFVIGSPSFVTVTITDNDSSPPTTNPIDDPQFFVRQQYLDFLNREPDAGGLAFWSGKITNCGSDAVCINRERVTVSAAFFTSPEFQGTGGTVIRMYKAAFDGQAGQRPLYLEFMRDRGRLIVGSQLAATKQALADDFVTRPEFVAAFPAFFTPAQYVDGLNANTGNSLTQAERDALVNGMIGGTETRATVLIKVADNALFAQRQNNPAFVLMEYFGYLRRDIDTGGFLFWLSVLNSTGNPNGMVCAFITSGEYQDRFSPIRTRNDSVCGGL